MAAERPAEDSVAHQIESAKLRVHELLFGSFHMQRAKSRRGKRTVSSDRSRYTTSPKTALGFSSRCGTCPQLECFVLLFGENINSPRGYLNSHHNGQLG